MKTCATCATCTLWKPDRGTMDGFPEGWERPKQFREKGFQKQKEEIKNA